MVKTPLYSALSEYNTKEFSSFHTPGHKGHKLGINNFYSLDLTELPETDNLYDSSGVIFYSEELTKRLFNVKKTLFSAGGNTLCIQTMLRVCSPQGGTIISGRLIHRSAVAAMALLDIQPEWIFPNLNSQSGLMNGIDGYQVKQKLEQIENVNAVYITSPDYYGIISDISTISNECKKHGVPLLMDNAHGAHLSLLGKNLHPASLGATMIADSVHKTLPALTGGAWLHITDLSLCRYAKEAMLMFGSTSPSYPIMCSLDLCRNWMDEEGIDCFKELESKVDDIKREAILKGIYVLGGRCDPVRICFNVSSIGYSGSEYSEYLRKFKIEPEFYDRDYVVLIPSPFNTDEDFEKLRYAIERTKIKNNKSLKYISYYNVPRVVMTLREAMMSKFTEISVGNCVNRVAADIVCPCPPGMPIVMPGEIIGEYEQKKLIDCRISNIKVVK